MDRRTLLARFPDHQHWQRLSPRSRRDRAAEIITGLLDALEREDSTADGWTVLLLDDSLAYLRTGNPDEALKAAARALMEPEERGKGGRPEWVESTAGIPVLRERLTALRARWNGDGASAEGVGT